MSQTIISLIHCLQGKIDVTNVTHTWYLCFLCTTRGPHTQFLMAFSNYILQFYIWYELVHSFTSSQAKDKSCYREAKNTFLPKWNIVWILCKGSPPQMPGGCLWIQSRRLCYICSYNLTLTIKCNMYIVAQPMIVKPWTLLWWTRKSFEKFQNAIFFKVSKIPFMG